MTVGCEGRYLYSYGKLYSGEMYSGEEKSFRIKALQEYISLAGEKTRVRLGQQNHPSWVKMASTVRSIKSKNNVFLVSYGYLYIFRPVFAPFRGWF